MWARKARKNLKTRKARRKMKARKKMMARTKHRYKGTQACKTRDNVKNVGT